MQRLPVSVRQEEGALASFINTPDRVTVVYTFSTEIRAALFIISSPHNKQKAVCFLNQEASSS